MSIGRAKSLYMVFDVESVGLHGEGFSVGYVVIEGTEEIESGYYRCSPDYAMGLAEGRKWIEENVVPAMETGLGQTYSDGIGSPDPKTVRAKFWARWGVWKVNGAVLAADCPWPVEARFLAQCIDDDLFLRQWAGPYPFIDIASVRLAAGLDPLGTAQRLTRELPVHHPLADARQSARLLVEAMNAIAGDDR